MLRCEKTHFYGYFSKPNGEITAVACPDAIKAYTLKYNEIRPEIYGHRIHTASLILMGNMKLPERVQNTSTLISLLVDKYEANKSKNKKMVEYSVTLR